jgi:hypothetical protein
VALVRLGVMAEPTYTVMALDQSTWAAFAALVERNNGIFGGCWCMGFHPEDSRTDAARNRAAKEQRVRQGRRQGVAAAALAGALDLIAGLGGGTVEGYPEDAGSVPAGFLFNGALSTYEKLGFARDCKIGKHRWVVARVVEPRT